MLQRSMSQLLLLRLLFDIATYVRCRLPICAHLCVPNFLIDITSSALQRVKNGQRFLSFFGSKQKCAKNLGFEDASQQNLRLVQTGHHIWHH